MFYIKINIQSKFCKKTLLFSLLCLLCTVNLFADNPVSVQLGDVSVLKHPSKALLEIDYSATKIGEQTLDEYLKERGNDFVKDWPHDKEKAAGYFKTYFHKKNKGMKLTTDVTDAAYKMIIHVNTLDMGWGGGMFFSSVAAPKAGGCTMVESIDIINIKTNEIVCMLYVDEVKGISHASETLRLGFMYNELAVKICKLK